MTTSWRLSPLAGTTALSMILVLGGCNGVLGDPAQQGNDPTQQGDGDGDSNTPIDSDDPRTCVPGIPATSQIPRLLNREYDAVIRDLLGVTALQSGGAPSSVLVPDYDGSLTDIAWNAYLVAGRDIAAQVISGANRPMFMTCDPAVQGCFTDTIRTFGRKAFRRPLTDVEVASFERLLTLEPAGTPDEIAEAILFAFLASPSFLLLPELSPEKDGDYFKLTPHETAVRLSFLLWGSLPDDQLSAAADAGALSTPAQLLEHAARLIGDRTKTAPIVREFHRDYAFIKDGSHWATLDHDTALFPDYSPAVIAPMMAEIDAFFEAVTFGNGTFGDLFLSSVGFVNNATAALYDLDPAAYGAELTPVTLNADERPGFLTRIGFLSSYSGYSNTSPILRGAYISERILGIEIAAPPPGATEKEQPEGNYTTNRQMVEALTDPQPCGGCHSTYINPPGFVLEKYNSVGEWQITDPLGGAIDGSGEVYLTETESTTITTPVELMRGIAGTQEARRRYAEAWVSFGSKRAPNSNDACVVDELSAKLTTEGYPILSLLTDLTQSSSFTKRSRAN